jgi:hypothetical protein
LESHWNIIEILDQSPDKNFQVLPKSEELFGGVMLAIYPNFQDTKQQIGNFIDRVYQYKRIHSSLGYLTPVEYEQNWWVNHRKEDSPLDSSILCPV